MKLYYYIIFILCLFLKGSYTYKILGIFPYNGRSHHIIFSRFMEELAERKHDVTVINYFPMKKMENLKQISLQNLGYVSKDTIDLQMLYEDLPYFFREFYMAKKTADAFKYIANTNCEKMFDHPEILKLLKSDTHFDVVIVEQFVTDCGLGLVHHFKSPAIGVAAHVLMPYTYARFGIPNNPAFVPNHFMGTGTKPDIWGEIKSLIINEYFKWFYRNEIQQRDHEIITKVLPDTPDLEIIAHNLTLILVNQYYPLTGSRLYPANVIEVGGMHIKQGSLQDQELLDWIEGATNGVIFISLGTVTKSTSLPEQKLKQLLSFIRNSTQRFIWKREIEHLTDSPPNLMIREWMPQVEILCHSRVVGFISHAGMLGTLEAFHCGIPIINVPLFGDQFANAASVRESGMGVTVEYENFDEEHLTMALKTISQLDHLRKAKELSSHWHNRPLPPLDTAVYWTEFIAQHSGALQLRPPTVDMPLYKYLMLDVFLVLSAVAMGVMYVLGILSRGVLRWCLMGDRRKNVKKKQKNK